MDAFVAQTVKCLPTMRQTWVRSPGLGRSPGEGNGNPLQCSCLENSMDGGAWWSTVHGVAKSRTRLSDFTSLCFMDSYQTFLLYTFPKFSRQSLSSLWLDVIMWLILANELWTDVTVITSSLEHLIAGVRPPQRSFSPAVLSVFQMIALPWSLSLKWG